MSLPNDNSEYKVMYPVPAAVYEPFVYILDTNVVIDIEWFFLNPARLGKRKDSLLTLLVELEYKDIIPGLACYEVAWPCWSKQPNIERWTRIRTAVESVQQWSASKLVEHSMSNGLDYQHTQAKYAPPFNIGDFTFVMVSYAALLKLCELYRQKARRNRLTLFDEYADWLSSELKCSGSYEFVIGLHLLFGRGREKEFAEKLLKPSKKNSSQAMWNAAWDIFFVRILEMSSLGQFPSADTTEVALVTRDVAIQTIQKYCFLRACVSFGGPGNFHEFVVPSSYQATKQESDAIAQIVDQRFTQVNQRVCSNIANELGSDRMREIVIDLENKTNSAGMDH